MLWPQAQRTAKIASPIRPFKGHLARRPSAFICPISGSMALRRFRSLASDGVMPRRMGVVAEVRHLPHPPLSPLRSGHALDLGGAEGVEAVHEGNADVDFGGLAVRVT